MRVGGRSAIAANAPPRALRNAASRAVEVLTRRHLDIVSYFYIIGIVETLTVVAALGALAQETRLAIYRLLVESGPAGLPAGSIATSLGVAAPTLSFHLKELAHAGLVTSEPHGRFVVYRADYRAMNSLLAFLTANCCRGSECAGGDSVVCVPIPTPARRVTHSAPRAAKSRRVR